MPQRDNLRAAGRVRAAASAVSLASVPLEVKKLFFSLPGAMAASRSASADCGPLAYSVETCDSVFTCSTIAATTRGLLCPTLIVSTPPNASK